MKDLYEVEFASMVATHTDLVRGRYNQVKAWAEKEASAYGAEVRDIRPAEPPTNRKDHNKIILLP